VLAGKRRVDGVEADLTGQITPNWDLYSSVAVMDGKIVTGSPNVQGNTPLGVARVAGSVWTVYRLASLEIGGGVRVAIRERIDAASWVDGNVTSGHQSAQAKYNEQVPEDAPESRGAGDTILAALARSALFFSAALPRQVYPLLFNRYRGDMRFGNHVDGAMRVHGSTGRRIRTDLSATLFLTPPDDYDGGELVIEDTYGAHPVKLAAGDLVIYPATSVHRVTSVTRGVRVSSVFWIESMVRDDGRCTLLFDMDMALVQLARDVRDHPSLIALTGCYHNLLRAWGES